MIGKKLHTESSDRTTDSTTIHNKIILESDAIYSVYIHHKKDENIENLIRWERRESTPNREKAITRARDLYRSYSHDCDKVEVKKTYHNPKQNKMIDKTIKTYGDDNIGSISCPIKIALTILCTALCTAIGMWAWG